MSSSFVPKIISRTIITAEAISAVRSAHPNESTWIALSLISEVIRSMTASRTSTSRKPADQRVGQPQRRDERREERVQDRDQRGGDDRPAEPVDRHVRDEVRGDEQRERRDQPGENDARRPEARARRSPRGVLAVGGARHGARLEPQSKVADPPGGSIRTSTPGTSSATCRANSSAGARSTEPRPPFQERPE